MGAGCPSAEIIVVTGTDLMQRFRCKSKTTNHETHAAAQLNLLSSGVAVISSAWFGRKPDRVTDQSLRLVMLRLGSSCDQQCTLFQSVEGEGAETLEDVSGSPHSMQPAVGQRRVAALCVERRGSAGRASLVQTARTAQPWYQGPHLRRVDINL